MKKVFAILAVAGFLAACNNKAEKKTDEVKDSATNMMNNAVDSTTNMMNNTIDSAGNMMNNAADTMKPKM
jgi:protein involved in sex pheromone biosynthesis